MPSAARGAALVGLAVIVAIIGLQILDDSSPSTSNAGTTTTTTNVGPTTTSGLGTSTTKSGATTSTNKSGTTSTTRAPSQIKVVVLNASGVQGAAQTATNKLKGLGYNTLVPATSSQLQSGISIECKSGLGKEALVLAFIVGSGAKSAAFPSSVPTGAEGADCIVLLGKTT